MEKKPGISFGFKATSDTGPLKSKSAIVNETKEFIEETDFVKSVDGTNINSVNESATKKKLEDLVIPLIQKNNWRTKASGDKKDENGIDLDKNDENYLTKLAAKELIEAARNRENEETKSNHGGDMSIPLLLQNKIPEGYETDEKVNTELRPTESTIEDYEEVPLEHFGLAMLRGMGWKEGQGIGKNNKDVKIVEAHLRPKGMGLGADRSRVLQEKSGKKRKLKPGDKKEEEALDFKKGVNCAILKGPHADLYATIQGVDDDNCRCVIKLSLSQETIDISQFSLRLVDKKEFDKYSKYLNKGKADQYKSKHSNGADNPSAEEHRERSPSAKKKRKDDTDKKKKSDKEKSSKHSAPSHWIHPLLKVKIIDRKYKDGRYYLSKVIVYDVLPDTVVCKSDSGRLLEGLKEGQLESVIPREDKSYVMLVAGEHRKEIGQVVQRNRDKEQLTVQLLSDRSTLVTLHYDNVCEYTGNVDHLLEY